jgi:predicted ester cyclase
MRTTMIGAVLLALLGSACGGQSEVAAPPPPPPPATEAVAPPPPPAETAAPASEAPKMSMMDMQKKSMIDGLAALNGHDSKKYSEGFATDGTVTVVGEGEFKGRDAIAGELDPWFKAFPDFKIAVTRVFAKGDVVVSEWVVTGTNTGELMGDKPTKKAIGFKGASVNWFTPEGLLKQEHRYFDMATLMGQLGKGKGMPFRPVATAPTGEPEVHAAKGTPDEDKIVELNKVVYAAFEKKAEADFLGAADDKVSWSDQMAPKDTGKAEMKKFFQTYTKAIPDVKVAGETVFAADGFAVAEFTMSGTQSGAIGPLKASKTPLAFHGVDIVEIKDGKAVKGTTYGNTFEILGQRNLLPKPKAAKTEEKKADKAEKAADKAEKKADKAEKAADKAEKKADKAEKAADKAEKKADKAEKAADKAEKKEEKK